MADLKIPSNDVFLESLLHPENAPNLESVSCRNNLRMAVKYRSLSSRLSPYLVALRPWSFTTSLCPVGLGSCLVYKTHGLFNFWILFTTCLCVLFVHAAGNLVNTYFDYIKGVDSKKSDDRTLVDHLLEPNHVVTMGAVSYVLGCIGFLILSFISPSSMEHIALLYFGGLSGSFLYTGGLGLKYIALGDLAIFLTFGPVAVLFAYIAQGGDLNINPLLYAIPLALNTEAILHANNTRNMETDEESGILTLAIILGRTGSYVLFVFLLFFPYIIFMFLSFMFSKWFFLPLVTLVLALEAERNFRKGIFLHLPQVVAKLNLLVGICYICACLLVTSE